MRRVRSRAVPAVSELREQPYRTRIPPTRRSSRREEARISVAATEAQKLEPPHVGCYRPLSEKTQ